MVFSLPGVIPVSAELDWPRTWAFDGMLPECPQRRTRTAKRHRRRQLLDQLLAGDVRTGAVRSIIHCGVFVDLGGVEGLIHISELDWRYVTDPSTALSVGDRVQVYVLRVDRERGRISLTRKRLLPDPWPIATESLCEGQVIDGKVTSVVTFGAFVDVGTGIERLAHASEMPNSDESRARLEPGSPVRVAVLKIDHWRRRISPGLRGVEQPTLLWPEPCFQCA